MIAFFFRGLALCLLAVLLGWGRESVQAGERVQGGWEVSVHPELFFWKRPTLEPQPEAVQVEVQTMDGLGNGASLDLRAYTKKVVGRAGGIWVEIYISNPLDVPLENIQLQIDPVEGSKGFYDVTRDPHQDVLSTDVQGFPRIAAHGTERLALVLPERSSSFKLTLTADTGKYAAKNSAPIAVTPDGLEVWSVVPDADAVVVLDAQTDTVKQVIPIPGRPSGLDFMADGSLVAVVAAKANTITLLDVQSKEIRQVVSEEDGLDRELRHIVADPQGQNLYVASYVEGTIERLTLQDDGRLVPSGKLAIGARPTGMGIHPDGKVLQVSHFLPRGPIAHNEAWISRIDTKSMQLMSEGIIHDHFNRDSHTLECQSKAYRNPYTGKLSADDLTLEGVASQLAGAFLPPSGNYTWVPGTRVPGAVIVLERGEGADPDLRRFSGQLPGQYVVPMVFLFDNRTPGKTLPMIAAANEITTVGPVKECFEDHQLELEFIERNVVNKREQMNPFIAMPVGQSSLSETGLIRHMAFTKGGRRALLLSYIADEIAVYDAATLFPESQLHVPLSGSNPIGITVHPEGHKAYVAYENSFHISVMDISAYNKQEELPSPHFVPYRYGVKLGEQLIQFGNVLGLPLIRNIDDVMRRPPVYEVRKVEIPVKDPLSPQMRRGKVLFSSANPDKHPISLSRLGACEGCHPDGGSDGSGWATMEGERRTMSLRGGVAGRGWLHASATHPDVSNFASEIVEERLGGHLNPRDQDALSRYVAHGIPRLQSPKVDADLATAGKRLFEASCTGCHAGPQYTSGNPDANHPLGGSSGEPVLFDIGTGTDTMHITAGRFYSELFRLVDPPSADIMELVRGDRDLGEGDPLQEILAFRQRPARQKGYLKAPSLVNVFDYAVFFHDGSVATLKGAMERLNQLQKFGYTEQEIDALTEYLKTL